MIKYMAVAVAVAVSGGVAVPVAVPVAVRVAGLTKRFFNQKDFLINVLGYPVSGPKHFFWAANSRLVMYIPAMGNDDNDHRIYH